MRSNHRKSQEVRLGRGGEFAFESTPSGLHYAKRLEDWKGLT